MHEIHNLLLLQLHRCTSRPAVIRLEGLHSLCHLELVELIKLVTFALTGRSSGNAGIYESVLQNVLLEDLESDVTHVPDFRACIIQA